MDVKYFKKIVNADTISLAEIGWDESRDDNQIKKYVKLFIQKNYEKNIDDELALIIVWIIDDLLSDINNLKGGTVNKKEDDGLPPTDESVGIRPTIL